jgi:hypothetical protein
MSAASSRAQLSVFVRGSGGAVAAYESGRSVGAERVVCAVRVAVAAAGDWIFGNDRDVERCGRAGSAGDGWVYGTCAIWGRAEGVDRANGSGLPCAVWYVLCGTGVGAFYCGEGDGGVGAEVDAGWAAILGDCDGRVSLDGRSGDWERRLRGDCRAIADGDDRSVWFIHLGTGAGRESRGSFCLVREHGESSTTGGGLGDGGLDASRKDEIGKWKMLNGKRKGLKVEKLDSRTVEQ